MKNSILGILAVALVSTPAFAKENKTLWENLNRLSDGQKIQVVLMNSTASTGKFQSYSEDSITIEVEKKQIQIQRADIRRVVRQKSRTIHILEGLGIGIGVGAAVVAANQRDDSIYPALAAFPVFVGGGAVVGAAIPTKSLVYERP